MTSTILDTSVVIEYLSHHDNLAITTIGLGELYYGAYLSSQLDRHVAECKLIEQTLTIIGVDQPVSQEFAKIKKALRDAGKMIPENDIWIAAIAMRQNSLLLTMDGHFTRIDDLNVILLEKGKS